MHFNFCRLIFHKWFYFFIRLHILNSHSDHCTIRIQWVPKFPRMKHLQMAADSRNAANIKSHKSLCKYWRTFMCTGGPGLYLHCILCIFQPVFVDMQKVHIHHMDHSWQPSTCRCGWCHNVYVLHHLYCPFSVHAWEWCVSVYIASCTLMIISIWWHCLNYFITLNYTIKVTSLCSTRYWVLGKQAIYHCYSVAYNSVCNRCLIYVFRKFCSQ